MKSPPFCAIINLLDYDTWKGAFFMGRKNPAKNINIGLLAHVDAGKTTLSEALLYATGQIRALGRVDHQDVTLTLKEFELLCMLLENSGIVLTRAQLLDRIWGYAFDGESRTVDVHVRTLRQKLGACGALIQTVRGIGYKIGGDEA